MAGVDITIKSNLDVDCSECGLPLEASFEERTDTIKVEPCVSCLLKEKEAGVQEACDGMDALEKQIEELKAQIKSLEEGS